jgi:actin-related protein
MTDGWQSSGVEVNVISHKRQRYAVWYGGSLMASTVGLSPACTRLKELMTTSLSSITYLTAG